MEDLIAELSWLERLMHERISADPRTENSLNDRGRTDIYSIKPPDVEESDSHYALFIKANQLSFEERVLLILSVAPHLKPEFIDLYVQPPAGNLRFYTLPECLYPLIGTRGQNYKGFLPTGLTYLYILAGTDLKERVRLQNLLSTMAKPAFQKAVLIQPHNAGEPVFSGRIIIAEEFLELFTINQPDKINSIKYAFTN